MIGFLAIAVGSIGIGAAAHFHLLRSMDTVAILKSLGATTERIMSVYLLQVVCLASTGIVLGVASGGLVEVLLGKLAIGYLGAQIDGANRVAVALETAIFSLLVASVAAWVPLSRIRFIPAAVLLRRDTGEKLQLQRSIAERIRFRPTVLLVVLGIAALVIFQPGESWRGRAFLLLGIGVGVSAVYAISQASIAALFHIIRARGQNLPWSVRQGIGNLHRYHRQARTVIVALASAVAFIVIALLAGRHLQAYILDAIPFHTPNLLFIYVDETRKAELSEVLAHQPGVEGRPQFIPTAWVALSRAGNSTLETLRAGRPQTWIPRDWPASCSDSKPPSVDVVAGQWWSPGTPDNNVALSEDLAELFGVHVGSRMDFVVGRRPIQARLGALLRIPPAQRAWWREIVFNCQVLPRALYSGAITIAPEHLDDVRQSLHERFPEVILLDINDLLQRTERIGAQALRILSIIGVVAAFLAGCLLLAVIGSVRAFRVYDIAIMRALGARKSTLLAPLAMEYLALGGLAGLFGGVLGCLATSLILRQAAGILIWTLDPYAIAIATIGGAALAALFGLLGSITLLQPKPLEILRRH
jgi:putative ABC transport system permease protein